MKSGCGKRRKRRRHRVRRHDGTDSMGLHSPEKVVGTGFESPKGF